MSILLDWRFSPFAAAIGGEQVFFLAEISATPGSKSIATGLANPTALHFVSIQEGTPPMT